MTGRTEEEKLHLQLTFHVYCRTVLYYESISAYRSIYKKARIETAFDEDFVASEAVTSIPTNFMIRGVKIPIHSDRLAEALLELPEKYREIILLEFFGGYQDQDLATLFQKNKRTINYHKHVALNRLKEAMVITDEV